MMLLFENVLLDVVPNSRLVHHYTFIDSHSAGVQESIPWRLLLVLDFVQSFWFFNRVPFRVVRRANTAMSNKVN